MKLYTLYFRNTTSHYSGSIENCSLSLQSCRVLRFFFLTDILKYWQFIDHHIEMKHKNNTGYFYWSLFFFCVSSIARIIDKLVVSIVSLIVLLACFYYFKDTVKEELKWNGYVGSAGLVLA